MLERCESLAEGFSILLQSPRVHDRVGDEIEELNGVEVMVTLRQTFERRGWDEAHPVGGEELQHDDGGEDCEDEDDDENEKHRGGVGLGHVLEPAVRLLVLRFVERLRRRRPLSEVAEDDGVENDDG